jgi:transcriptional regulator with XRE-family HTH domain
MVAPRTDRVVPASAPLAACRPSGTAESGAWPARVNFGRRLRHWRRAAGLTQADLGRKLAYDHSFISRVECGTRWPPRDLAVRCDEVLGTSHELIHLWRLAERERRRATSPAPDAAALAGLATLLGTYGAIDRAGGAVDPVLQWLAGVPQPLLRRLIALGADYARLAGQAGGTAGQPRSRDRQPGALVRVAALPEAAPDRRAG